MGIRFKKDGEHVNNMGELIDNKQYHYDGGNPPSKHPDDIKKGQAGFQDSKPLKPQFTKEYPKPLKEQVNDFINNSYIENGPEMDNLKALLAVREELVEVKLENEILSSKLKQIYLITNSK